VYKYIELNVNITGVKIRMTYVSR